MISVNDFKRVLYSSETIEARVRELAKEIVEDFRGQELVVLTVLRGASDFSHNLLKAMTAYSLQKYEDLVVDTIETDTKLSRRPNPNVFLSEPVMLLPLDPNIPYEGRRVLIVEDIVDQGKTMQYLLDKVREREPLSVDICTLLDKPSQREVEINPKYIGFTVGNVFVAGYGLDVNEKYRSIPFIGELKPEVIKRMTGKK